VGRRSITAKSSRWFGLTAACGLAGGEGAPENVDHKRHTTTTVGHSGKRFCRADTKKSINPHGGGQLFTPPVQGAGRPTGHFLADHWNIAPGLRDGVNASQLLGMAPRRAIPSRMDSPRTLDTGFQTNGSNLHVTHRDKHFPVATPDQGTCVSSDPGLQAALVA